MRTRLALSLILGLLLAACARAPERPAVAPAAVPPGFPSAHYADAAARGEPVFRVDSTRSRIVVRVYRAGPLARFGHDHVVASRDMDGYVALAAAGGAARADLYIPLATLIVDEPRLRAEAGFDTRPSEKDIEATRRNMLDEVLEAARYPYAVLRLARVEAAADASVLEAAVTLHGETRRLPVDVELHDSSAEALYARGRFSLDQTDFGITPFSAFGGALRVADRLDVAFTLYAVRAPAP